MDPTLMTEVWGGVDGVICFADLKASVRVLIPKTQVWGSIVDPTYESADDILCHVIDSC